MRRWFMDLPVMRKLLLGFGFLSPLVLGMIIIDISLSIQLLDIVGQIAHHPSALQIATETASISTISHQLLLCNLLMGGLAIVLGCACSILMSRVITRPLRHAQAVARQASDVWLMELADGLVALAQGNWSVSVKQRSLPTFYKSQDEIGQITQSVQKIMTTIYNMSFIYETTREELKTLYTCIQEQNETLSIANSHLNSLATTDPLTGLPNHRDIMDRIDKEIVHCQDTQRNCAIIFVDVDRCKCINDTWGMARAIRSCTLLGNNCALTYAWKTTLDATAAKSSQSCLLTSSSMKLLSLPSACATQSDTALPLAGR